MPRVDLICLANSNKMRGRCVAGLRIDGQGWVRPIAPDTDHGQLYLRHLRLEDGADPEILDVIRVDLANRQPSPGQPENWIIGERPWSLIVRPAPPELHSVLNSALVSGPLLLGSTGKRTAASLTVQATTSLALIAPSNLRWFVEHDLYDRLQPRVAFELGGTSYNLPITDPAWTSRLVRTLSKLESGMYPQDIVGIAKDSKILFTISLGEAFYGYYYKLVAGIVVIPHCDLTARQR